MCRSLLIGMEGTHEFRVFPSEVVQVDLFEDGNEHDVTVHPTPVAQQFTATFAPCGCKWEARVGSRELQMYVLRIIHADAGARFEFGHRQHDSRYLPYVMTHERTQP